MTKLKYNDINTNRGIFPNITDSLGYFPPKNGNLQFFFISQIGIARMSNSEWRIYFCIVTQCGFVTRYNKALLTYLLT